MGRVLESVNNTLNAYYKMNSQVGNERQTSLKQIKDMMGEKWNELCNAWIPKYSEECPSMDKCYREEFDSFYSLNNSKEMDVVNQYNETSIKGEIETLEIDVPQKKL